MIQPSFDSLMRQNFNLWNERSYPKFRIFHNFWINLWVPFFFECPNDFASYFFKSIIDCINTPNLPFSYCSNRNINYILFIFARLFEPVMQFNIFLNKRLHHFRLWLGNWSHLMHVWWKTYWLFDPPETIENYLSFVETLEILSLLWSQNTNDCP